MSYREIVTSDLADFGARERMMAADLLKAANDQGFPSDFYDDGVTVAMNRNSGYVFLTNSEYQVAMLNGDKLETFYSCPGCGEEGFVDEIDHEGNRECRRFLREIAKVSA